MKTLTADRETIESIIRRAAVCHVAMCDGGQPYVVPVCFGYENGVLYVHSSPKGKKLDILRKNDAVCVAFDVDQEIVRAEEACRWSIRYRSVIGFGRASLVETTEEKRKALDAIMAHYGGEPPYSYRETTLAKTTVVRVDIETMAAKVAGYESLIPSRTEN